MSHEIFKIYMRLKKLIEKSGDSEIPGFDQREVVSDWKSCAEELEANHPEYPTRYARLKKAQDSFTPEQIDFICYQIGDWYLEWKERIVVDLKYGTHRLGYAKEELKTLICGE